ncbi:fatty acyl-AMP ligase [Streptomyces sp. NPDC093595]|uniref:fatty acyl-AMP ligase n=1 Tax=Streptomyces sp. NPDC093595 TaxID=3366045 RepID=UPI0038025E44
MTVPMTFVSRVRDRVERSGDTCSFTFVGGADPLDERVLSFAALDERARCIAAWLAGRPRRRAVLLMYPAGPAFLEAFVGCLYAGAVAIPAPLPTTDPRALERAARIIGDADVGLLLTDSAHEDELRRWIEETGLENVDCVALDDASATVLPEASAWTMPDIGPDDIAYLQYTSGSTSEPRGVVVTHRNLLQNVHDIWRLFGSPEHGVGVGWLPHYHDMGLVGQFLMPLQRGLSIVFTSPLSFIRRPVLWLELISRHRAEYTAAPDFAYDWCTAYIPDDQIRDLDLSCLKLAMNGAEPVRAATLDAFTRRFEPVGFRRTAWLPAYGMAEATLLVSGTAKTEEPTVLAVDAGELERDRAVPSDGPAAIRLVSSGRPLSLDVRVVEPRSREALPDGEIGEIWLSGASVAGGYWNDPAGTAETFGGRLATGEGPFLRTGDLGFLRAGEVFVTGRLKDIVIVNGRNIYPQDIEAAARDVHPALGPSAAFTADGQGEHVVLVQEVRTNRLGALTAPELADEVEAALRDRLRLPGVSVVLVRNGRVERTTSGKVRRRRMRELFLTGGLDPVHRSLSGSLAAVLERRAGAVSAAEATPVAVER